MSLRIAVIGGGASGLLSAILLAKKSHQVTLFEANTKVAKKILVSGNGHCNISNTKISPSNFHGLDPDFASYCLNQFDFLHLEKLLKSFGLLLETKPDGKAYPKSFEAKSVVDIFLMTAENLGVKVLCNSKINGITFNDSFTLKSDDGVFDKFDKVVVATGGKASESLGGNESGYEMAQSFGHEISSLYPSLVQLCLSDMHHEAMSGVKRYSRVRLIVDKQNEGDFEGDVLFTRYGISGLAILDLSQKASYALDMGSRVEIAVNLFPEYERQKLDSQILGLCKQLPNANLSALLSGLVHSKIIGEIFKNLKLSPSMKACDIDAKIVKKIVNLLLNWRFEVTDTHGFKHAEVCGGGVLTFDVDSKTMESQKQKGLYFIGEVLDVVGDRGGYNFHFAFASAYALALSI